MKGKSNNNDKHLWFYILYKKLYFARKYLVWKKSSLYHHILFTVFMRSNIFEMCSNNRRKLNIHKHTNYIIIEKYINRLSATTQNFIAMEYFILMSEKHLHFRKKKKACDKEIFSHSVEVTESMHFGNIFRIMFISKICTKP